MKIARIIFKIFLLTCTINSFSQSAACDSVMIGISGYNSGNVQWQDSPDGISWTNIAGAVSENIYAAQEKYYRVLVTEGTCSPYISDTLHYQKPQPFSQNELDSIYFKDANTAFRILQIYTQPDSIILRTPSIEMSLCDTASLRYLMNRMMKTVKGVGVGVAAPQVGFNRRAACVQRYDKLPANNPPFEFYINPRITAYSDTVVLSSDGCLSVPTGGIYPHVVSATYRAIWVVVEYYLLDGTYKQEKITDQYTAHIFQHELDHLDGIMYFDRAGQKNMKHKIIQSKAFRPSTTNRE